MGPFIARSAIVERAEAATNIHALREPLASLNLTSGKCDHVGGNGEVRQTRGGHGWQDARRCQQRSMNCKTTTPRLRCLEDDLAHACFFTWTSQPPVMAQKHPMRFNVRSEQGFREVVDGQRPYPAVWTQSQSSGLTGADSAHPTDVVTLRDMVEDLSKEILGNLDMSKAEEEAELERQKKGKACMTRVLAARVKVQGKAVGGSKGRRQGNRKGAEEGRGR